jgi:tRNA-specific 2-thiouridylase
VRIRYHHEPAAATLDPLDDGTVRVRFETPQLAVTPGQLAVFYDGDRVLGGAAIERSLTEHMGAGNAARAATASPTSTPVVAAAS